MAHWPRPLAESSLFDWHAALFPNGRSGITRIGFVGRVEQACLATLDQMQTAASKSAFRLELQAAHPDLTPSQRKVLNKLFDAQPEGFAGGMSTEKYTAITGVSRATAYRELTQLADAGLLERSGQGRGTRYALVPRNASRI